MFEFLLILAIVIAIALGIVFFRADKVDSSRIITKLESLNKDLANDQSSDEFSCILRHSKDKLDQLMAFPKSKSDEGSAVLGIVPYEHKGRILHFENTKHLRYQASFNRKTEEMTIDLIDDLAKKDA